MSVALQDVAAALREDRGMMPVAPPKPDSTPFTEWLFTRARTEVGPFPDWPYLRSYAEALESGSDLIVLKRRQILISWVTAAYYHFNASRRPYCHGAVVSAGKTASSKQGRRIVTVARHDGYDVRGVDLIKYPSGSELTILPSTEHAGVGESLPLGAHFDEFAFHPYAAANMATIQPAVSNSGGQTIITSTANPQLGTSTRFAELWEHPAEGMQKLFYGRYVRPDQDQDWLDGERAKYGTEYEFQAFYPESADDAFTSHAGLVYGPDADGVLLLHPVQNFQAPKWTWAESKWRLGGYDHGGRDPTAMVSVGVSADEHIQQFDEFCQRGATPASVIGEWFRRRHNVAPYHKIFCDPSAATVIETLRTDYGLPAEAADNDRGAGFQQLAGLFKSRRFTIDPRCEQTRKQLFTYWWDDRSNGGGGKDAWATKAGAGHHADLPDVLRYIAMGLIRGLPDLAQRQPMKLTRPRMY